MLPSSPPTPVRPGYLPPVDTRKTGKTTGGNREL